MLERIFKLKRNNTNIRTEIIAGITTFISGMYIIIVNPAILADAGIPYSAGLTATVILSAVSSIAMGLWAKNPIMIAPGMGINAYFTYSVVLALGIDPYIALGAIFWSGIIFILLSVFNIRTHIIKSIPKVIRIAGAVGIGLFISLIGFVNAGFIVAKPPLIGVGKIDIKSFIFIAGLFITIILVVKKYKAGFILSIAITTFLAWAIGQWIIPEATSSGNINSLVHWKGTYSSPDFSWFFKMKIFESLKYAYIPVIFAMLFVDMFDSITTFVGIAEAGNLKDKNGDPLNIKNSMIVDGFATFLGGLFGTSPGTAYIESAAGIHEGGRTGLTAVIIGLLFLPFMFLSPLAELIPSYAIAPVLIMVGVFMASPLNKIDWHNLEDAIPGFLTIVLIPLTYSLTQGIVYGLLSYTLIKLIKGKFKELSITLLLIDVFALVMLSIEYGLI